MPSTTSPKKTCKAGSIAVHGGSTDNSSLCSRPDYSSGSSHDRSLAGHNVRGPKDSVLWDRTKCNTLFSRDQKPATVKNSSLLVFPDGTNTCQFSPQQSSFFRLPDGTNTCRSSLPQSLLQSPSNVKDGDTDRIAASRQTSAWLHGEIGFNKRQRYMSCSRCSIVNHGMKPLSRTTSAPGLSDGHVEASTHLWPNARYITSAVYVQRDPPSPLHMPAYAGSYELAPIAFLGQENTPPPANTNLRFGASYG
ncbi:hypothetical protein FQN49_006585 [Arthroderma sp. PD_2]|nr:hypothetical protein FQN49_006585 [Arthroderma sp. PD_2]